MSGLYLTKDIPNLIQETARETCLPQSASQYWFFENRSMCNGLFKQIIEARSSNVSSAKPTSFPALPASSFLVLVIIRGLCSLM